ncbi:SDR family oxidoreductase [Bacillus sp. 31A1R]|uniref:SDR family oxidoreductase n=1 Tax=Robertmurraya mangrovi TaxID=3098077 RepID=A0ABU5J1Y4_9BACI|nr:SDR family oxidoreductase [Bacillus sp. 31A1R]MDZ5473371.1 SDR family oxidoreductase [Bacillus sp. 31A1R]
MRILLTGANGFLGKKVAMDLLDEGHELYLLVRNKNKLKTFFEELPGSEQRSRVHVLEGDVTSTNLGLLAEEIQGITSSIDAIYHMAALLSFDPNDRDFSYKVNVDGTKHVLDFAVTINCKKFFYVSTAYTIGMESEGFEELYSTDREFVNYYEETKCIAEHLVLSYSDQLFVSILRPAIIIGDSKTGQADTSFGLYGFLKSLYLLKRKMARNQDSRDRKFHVRINLDVNSNLVPVDYVSMVFVSALSYAKNKEIFNITNPNPPIHSDLIRVIKEVLDFPNLETISFDSDYQLREDEMLFNKPLDVFKSYWSHSRRFPCENTKRVLELSGKTPLDMDEKMLRTIIHGFVDKKVPVLK